MAPDDIIASLARHEALPRQAIRYSLEHPDEVVPAFLELLEDAAEGRFLGENLEALFLIIHILAELRERRAYRPLVAFLRGDQELVESLLGDAITETLPKVLISLYDGDMEPIRGLIEDRSVDEFVRDAGFAAWTYFAAQGEVTAEEARRYLLHCLETLEPKKHSHIWVSWIDAVTILGFADFRDAVRRVFEEQRLPPWVQTYEDFEQDLETFLTTMDREKLLRQERLEAFTDVIGHFETWHGYSEEYLREQRRERLLAETVEPLRNPVKHVGRNDPCPCGSGKKFKKCCLH